MNVLTPSWLVLVGALCAVVACSDETSTLADAALDAAAPRPDAAPVPDAAAPDAAPPADAAAADAEPARDAAPEDTGVVADSGESTPDASAAPDASAPSCGALASPCTGSQECGGQGLECIDPPGLCMPVMPTCGGFVMAQCPGLTPVCLYYRGADYGPCLTADQRLCICSDPVRRQYFPGC
jgi:hypothetical protein